LFENEKQTQLFELFWEKYPYLHSTLKIENAKFTCEKNMNEDILNCMKYVEHDFKDEIQDHTLNDEQLKVFELLIRQPTRLHILEGTTWSGMTFFIKYFTQYLQMQNKILLLIATTRVVVSTLIISTCSNNTHTI
jgi:hypothetical protein